LRRHEFLKAASTIRRSRRHNSTDFWQEGGKVVGSFSSFGKSLTEESSIRPSNPTASNMLNLSSCL
jgi:hypothetical protein